MLISKFDLYRNEWLDLVFSDRNKEYGAYELRQHYPQVMLKALGIMFVSILVVAFVFGVVLKPAIHKVEIVKMTEVPLIHMTMPPQTPPVKQPLPKAPKTPPAPQQHIATVQSPSLVVKPDVDVVKEPPTMTELQGKVLSSTTTSGTPNGTSIDVPKGPSGPPGGGDDVNNGGIGLEREPLPKGGFGTFENFLRKHLRYPEEASEAHIQGKVFMSFIIEKDGSLSNITIVRGPGYGTNEEALRVLKLAPAWDPGIQNNHPVRVQYTIPINFQLGDDDN
ncbi:MAG: energy transducer TonB [Mucilaginibacter sp.]